jgi:outer membrane protein OmpA-like peptidoglycan-associated protein
MKTRTRTLVNSILILLIGLSPCFVHSQEQTTVTGENVKKDEKKEKLARAASTVTYAIPEDKSASQERSTPIEQNSAWKKAMSLYSKRAYAEAIPYFEKAMQADSVNKMLLTKLGDCYRLTNNTQGKLLCYGTLVNEGIADPIHELYYGQALVENGEGEKAKPYFEKYGADSRGKNLASSFGKSKSYTRNTDAYNVTPVSFNSPQNDMCAVKYYNITVFASSRPSSTWVRKKQGWTSGDYMNIFATEKDQKGVEKKPLIFMKDVNTKYNDGPLCFNKDFYMVYYTTNNARKEERASDGTFKLRILEGELDENGLAIVKEPGFSNREYNFCHPTISPDGFTLYFASDQPDGKGGMDIYMSRKDSSGWWGPAVNMGDLINTAGNEVFPFIAPNGSLYFSSDGLDGLGGLDIYEAKLSGGKPAKLYNMGEPVNSRFDDFGIYLVEDCKSGYISSNRTHGGMDDDIFNLQVLRDVRRGKDLLIVTKDKSTGEPIANSKILVNQDTVFTNEKGEMLTMIEEDSYVTVKSLKEDYFPTYDSIAASSSTSEAFVKELALEKNPKLFLRALITDSKTNELLPGVNVRVIDINTNSTIDKYTTTESGDYFRFLFNNRVGDKLTYLVKLEKDGYLPRSVIFSQTITKPGEVNMNESANLTLGKVEVGMDLAKMIDLKPIYFDMGKSEIRPDAAIELDKIVEVMNEYPNMYIELGSHTDCRASAAENMKLSTARAKESVDYIIKRGINKLRITARGYGETKLLNNCICEGNVQSDCPEEEHARNRRTEFLITRLN